jgi:hypothetical protein
VKPQPEHIAEELTIVPVDTEQVPAVVSEIEPEEVKPEQSIGRKQIYSKQCKLHHASFISSS